MDKPRTKEPRLLTLCTKLLSAGKDSVLLEAHCGMCMLAGRFFFLLLFCTELPGISVLSLQSPLTFKAIQPLGRAGLQLWGPDCGTHSSTYPVPTTGIFSKKKVREHLPCEISLLQQLLITLIKWINTQTDRSELKAS